MEAAFTLIELLMVISILGLIAALAVPALKNMGKSNITISASRQLLDDVGRARQLAMSQRTTVYMVFVPSNYWESSPGMFNYKWWNSLTPGAQANATNLADKQLSGYTFVAAGQVGDQPGQHQWHYLMPWRSLPDGTFIAEQKFNSGSNQIASYNVLGFSYTNRIPFPTETNVPGVTPALPYLPYIAFNYLGQLTYDGRNLATHDEFIPLARGAVLPAINPSTKELQLGSPDVSETPPGNSSSSGYNMVRIDALTGRATLLYQKVQ